MYSITHIQYTGPSTAPDRTYDLLCVTPDSDTNPSFLIRRWGKAGAKGSAKIEMLDRASRAQVGLRAEERKRHDKFYHETKRDEYQADEGHEAFYIVRKLLSVLGKDHSIFEVLEDIKTTSHAIKGKSMADMLEKVKKGRKPGALEISPVRSFEDGKTYKEWGTW